MSDNNHIYETLPNRRRICFECEAPAPVRPPAITTRSINVALRRAGLALEIINNRDGYSYFISTETGGQIGESVMVCYLNQQTVEQWVEDARHAIKEGR